MSFDPTTFLNTTIEESNDTKITPCPAGEYLAVASKVDAKPWASKDSSSSGVRLEVTWEIEAVKDAASIMGAIQGIPLSAKKPSNLQTAVSTALSVGPQVGMAIGNAMGSPAAGIGAGLLAALFSYNSNIRG